jgi:hypothetical protein
MKEVEETAANPRRLFIFLLEWLNGQSIQSRGIGTQAQNRIPLELINLRVPS